MGPACFGFACGVLKPVREKFSGGQRDKHHSLSLVRYSPFSAEGAVWQEHEVGIEEKNGIVHLRLFVPQQKQPVEIDWIEISWQGDDEIKSQRWDF